MRKKYETWEDDHHYYDEFKNRTVVKQLMDLRLDPNAHFETKPSKAPRDLDNPYIAKLYEYPVLNRLGERLLFMRMNYAKYKVTRIRAGSDSHKDELIAKYTQIAIETRNKIAEHNLRLIVSVAKKYFIVNHTLEETISNGNVSLLKAIDKFDTNRLNNTGGTNKFSTYATWAIVKNFHRDYREAIADADKFLTGFDIDISAPREEDSGTSELLNIAKKQMAKLDKRSREILEMRLNADLTLEDVGNHFGITRERVRQIQNRAIKQLRELFDTEDCQFKKTKRKPKSSPPMRINRRPEIMLVKSGLFPDSVSAA